ncbi:MAG: hypothetical protein V3V37_06480, partial [Candidatus Adiutricales bacterium]
QRSTLSGDGPNFHESARLKNHQITALGVREKTEPLQSYIRKEVRKLPVRVALVFRDFLAILKQNPFN